MLEFLNESCQYIHIYRTLQLSKYALVKLQRATEMTHHRKV